MTNISQSDPINLSALQSAANEGSAIAATVMIAQRSQPNSDSVEQYRLTFHVNIFINLWREYMVAGISHRAGASAGTSIKQLDEEFGAK